MHFHMIVSLNFIFQSVTPGKFGKQESPRITPRTTPPGSVDYTIHVRHCRYIAMTSFRKMTGGCGVSCDLYLSFD